MSNVSFNILGEDYRVLSAKIHASKEHDVDGRSTSSLTAGFTTVEVVLDDKTTLLSEKVNPYSNISDAKLTILNPKDGQSEIEVEFTDLFIVDHVEKLKHDTDRPASVVLTISAATTTLAGAELYRADNPKHYTL